MSDQEAQFRLAAAQRTGEQGARNLQARQRAARPILKLYDDLVNIMVHRHAQRKADTVTAPFVNFDGGGVGSFIFSVCSEGASKRIVALEAKGGTFKIPI